MPLYKTCGKRSRAHNIRLMKREGRPQKQAVAIALDIERRAGCAGSKPRPNKPQKGSVPRSSKTSAKSSKRQRGAGKGRAAGKKPGVAVLDVLKGVVEDAPGVLTDAGAPIIPRDLPNARKHVRAAIAEGLLVPVGDVVWSPSKRGRGAPQHWRLTHEAQVMLDAHHESGKSSKGGALTGTNLFVLDELLKENPALRSAQGTPLRVHATSAPHARRLLQFGALEAVPEHRGHLRVTAKGEALLAESKAYFAREQAKLLSPQFTDAQLEDYLAANVVQAAVPGVGDPLDPVLPRSKTARQISEILTKGWIRLGTSPRILTSQGSLGRGMYYDLTMEGFEAIDRARARKGRVGGRPVRTSFSTPYGMAHAENFVLKIGKHSKIATKVVFDAEADVRGVRSPLEVKFTERMPARSAVPQAVAVIRHEREKGHLSGITTFLAGAAVGGAATAYALSTSYGKGVVASAGHAAGRAAYGMALSPSSRMALAEAASSGSIRAGHVYEPRTITTLAMLGLIQQIAPSSSAYAITDKGLEVLARKGVVT
jgi:hypothetical protein